MQPKAFHHQVRVRYIECDQQGIVFNSHYLAYYDVALTELWRQLCGSYAQLVQSGLI